MLEYYFDDIEIMQQLSFVNVAGCKCESAAGILHKLIKGFVFTMLLN